MEISELLFIIIFFLTAFLYSSVGHGGASGYLAIMALYGLAPADMKTSALMLNLLVSAIAFFSYYKGGFFNWRLFYPFALTSIPFAFLGSYIGVDPFWYKKILAVCLGIACVRLSGLIKTRDERAEFNLPLLPALIAGALIGALSGMIGIGGGILLSPLILIAGWGKLKETAAVSALFIFVNSFSGLAAMVPEISSVSVNYAVIFASVTGGLAGSMWGSRKAENQKLKLALGLVLFVAAIKLLTV